MQHQGGIWEPAVGPGIDGVAQDGGVQVLHVDPELMGTACVGIKVQEGVIAKLNVDGEGAPDAPVGKDVKLEVDCAGCNSHEGCYAVEHLFIVGRESNLVKGSYEQLRIGGAGILLIHIQITTYTEG